MNIYALSLAAALSLFLGYGPSQCPGTGGGHRHVIHLDEGCWEQLLQDEWMVGFCMPMVENCSRFERVWSSFATAMQWQQPGLAVARMQMEYSGTLVARFSLQRLPSILHVRNGTFRPLPVAYTLDELLQLAQGEWRQAQPLPIWRHPNGRVVGAKVLYLRAVNGVYGTKYLGGDYKRATFLVGLGSFLLFSTSLTVASSLYALARDKLMAK
ncbi:thioredoxin-related transmembrane protein 1-like [Drosophila guanche]|uniref:Blast:Thioredoxin-related transmembrane protein 1 n=1 Tax=Drosophila guanche TaxID=7266 RepID=A0A3B0JNI3_DROGU|nr:thioredoxin-related transmembrane protein 1-like [Drosophila guanche]SPP77070.1 blast:Thioredoxin-related transmembrane protein 1 [Drosophila guanche]